MDAWDGQNKNLPNFTLNAVNMSIHQRLRVENFVNWTWARRPRCLWGIEQSSMNKRSDPMLSRTSPCTVLWISDAYLKMSNTFTNVKLPSEFLKLSRARLPEKLMPNLLIRYWFFDFHQDDVNWSPLDLIHRLAFTPLSRLSSSTRKQNSLLTPKAEPEDKEKTNYFRSSETE